MEKGTPAGDGLTEKEENNAVCQVIAKDNPGNSEEFKLNEPNLRSFPLFRSLSPNVQKCILYLRELQLQHTKLQMFRCEEIHSLMVQYSNLCNPLLEKRRQIVNGFTQPLHNEPKNEEYDIQNSGNEASGISEFWLTVFLNSSKLSMLVEEDDEPILKHLEDIAVTYSNDSMDFTLEFHFKPNNYFSNLVLTKEYQMECKMNERDPYGFEGQKVIGCKGCVINWEEGKNVTNRSIKKKFNGKPVVRLVHKDSFFNFFDPPFINSDHDEMQEELMDDFELGLYIKDRIIPRAVLYYTMECHSESECSETDYSTDSPESFDSDFRTHQSRPRNKQ